MVTLCTGIKKGGWSKGVHPQNVDKKGDTAFRRWQGFRCSCDRRKQSNGPAKCLRFHGLVSLIYSPSLSPKSPKPNSLWYKHSPLRKSERTYGKTHLRTARVCFTQEEPHNIMRTFNRGRIRSSQCRKCCTSPRTLYTMSCICCCILLLQ